jgi:hypothetical protein
MSAISKTISTSRNGGSCLIRQSPVRQTDGFLLAHQSLFSATAQSWMLLPLFAYVDNPGRWNEFVFQPNYASEKGRNGEKKQMRYVGHTTPAGAKVVLANDDGIREINRWKFSYLGWQPNDFDATTFVRGMATRDDLKPADRKGCLDANRL